MDRQSFNRGEDQTMKHTLLAAAGLLALAAAVPATARTLGSLDFTPCTLKSAGVADTVEAQCTTLAVPENRAAPDARQIKLAIAWVPSSAADPAPDLVFMLAGGPGQAAREGFPQIAGAFGPTLRKRHVILVDQRGTGESNALACRDEQGDNAFSATTNDSIEAAVDFARGCAAKLDADPRFYTTTDAIQDLDAVRAALGAAQVDLVGISYGTRVAQQYAKRYPAQTRSVVLDGVVPNALVLGSEHAKNLEASLDLQFARCAQDKLCAERFGSPRANLDALFARLRSAPLPVSYRDPVSGEQKQEDFGVGDLAAVVRLFAYAPPVAAMLPLALHEAAEGRPQDLIAQSRMLTSVIGESIMHGMQLSVMCAEDAPELKPDPADALTTLGNAIIEVTLAQCAAWPHGERPADFRTPLTGDVPTLLLSGEFDPVTPPRYGEQVLAQLAKGRHLVARGAGHNVLPVGCTPRLLAEFLKTTDAAALDAKCLDDLTYAAPFAGYYGWEP
jgi:pimeloyl-ACP methyl ester carboxylesterase